MSSIVWTTLPWSVDPIGNTATVSVYVTPKLSGTTLDYPMSSWPTVANAATFQVAVYDGVNPKPVATIAATPQNGPFNLTLWNQIFPPQGMAVKPFALQDNSTRHLWSYPVDVLHEDIKKTYASVQASNATSFPVVDPLGASNTQSTLSASLASYATANAARVQTRLANFKKNGTNWGAWNSLELNAIANQDPHLTPVQTAAWLAKRFYDRPTTNKDIHGNRTDTAAINTTPTFDFHQRIAILADHPWLMRQLGIVIDLQFPIASVASMPSPGFIKVIPSWDTTGAYAQMNITPRTAYEISAVRFAARSGAAVDADVGGGMLEIEDPSRFYVTQGDPDGTAHKMIDYASNMVSMATFDVTEANKSATTNTPANESLPAQRTLGLTVTRIGRAAALQSRFTRVSQLHGSFTPGSAPLDLWAEDVLRGYRVDVGLGEPGGTQWASLHQRKVLYSINGTPLAGYSPPLDAINAPPQANFVYDEGFVHSASGASDSDPTGPSDLYVHEKIFAWHGWSLAASRPGQRIMPDGSVGAPNNPPTDPTFPVASSVYVAPGTLPPMRYGTQYALRARAVNLAGNSLALDDAGLSTAHVTAPQAIGRYEPVPHPVLVYPSGVTEGESIENVVIRSNPFDKINAAQMANTLNAAYADTVNNPYAFTDQGNPYKVYSANCDRHVAPPKESQIFAEMHGDFDGAFFQNIDPTAWYHLGTREEGTFMDTQVASLTDGSFISNPNNPIIVTPPQVPMDQRRALPASPGSVVARRGDPLAPGEYVICQPATTTLMTPYLPDSMAGGGVMWDPTTNGNAFKWSYAADAATDYSNWPNYGCIRVSLTEGAGVSYSPAAPSIAQAGTVLGLTLPPATILKLNYASTPRADRLAHLQYVNAYNPVDDITDGRHWMVSPSRSVTFVHAVQKPIVAPTATIFVLRDLSATFVSHSLDMTVHSNSTGTIDVSGEWFEFVDDPASPGPVKKPTTGHAYQLPIEYGQGNPVGGGLMSINIRSPQHEFGDTKHRFLEYIPTGTTRFKEYFPPGVISDPTQISVPGTATAGDVTPGAGPNVFNIPSSARPIAPKVEYVVPTFAWDPPTAVQSVRHGGGLRVYMDRPWYSSGEDEVVGVLLAPPLGLTPALQPFVSMWGRDPVQASPANAALTTASFKNAMGPTVQCVLAENGATVLVVPFAVQYHPGKKLWFCDIDMDPGQTYFPFVSLALVRYQPYSLKGVEISKVARADFAQLVPDRTLNVTKAATSLSITVTGVVADNYAGGLIAAPPGLTRKPPAGYVAAPTSHQIVASIQQRQAGSFGEMGWQTVGMSVSLTGIMTLNGGNATWSGTLPIPLASGLERRLLVEELEFYEEDAPAYAPGLNSNSHFTTSRLVYVDTFALT